MILVNGNQVNFTEFPDGTSSLRYSAEFHASVDPCRIVWKYDGEYECMRLYYLVKHLRAKGRIKEIVLEMPYIPNARLDRVKNTDEVFTLKYFAEFLNSMKFSRVYVLDAHSDVSLALIDNVIQQDVSRYILYALDWMAEKGIHPLLCFPDKGACKRYLDILGEAYRKGNIKRDYDYVHCDKDRDWRSGKILGTTLNEPEKVKDKDILIIDDICSKGGTFTYAAKALKAAGARDIMLYVTHCENTILKGSVLEDGLISKVFTTDSIIRAEHPMIHICCKEDSACQLSLNPRKCIPI